tara:strand:+ start:154 stop:1038 length:885 start_codon:yes stop_codon:yes gene_type:complete
MSKAFDFEFIALKESAKNVRLSPVGELKSRDFLDICLVDFKRYMAAFFAEDFGDALERFIADITKHNGAKASPADSMSSFMSEEKRSALRASSEWRGIYTYALTPDEEEHAKSYTQKHPEHFKAIMALQLALHSYFQAIKLEVLRGNWEGDEYKNFVLKIGYNCAHGFIASEINTGFSFIRDLAPILASQLHDGGDASDQDYAFALCQAFRLHAFKSDAEPTKSGLSGKSVCPFSFWITDIMATQFGRDADGNFTVKEDRKLGALMPFIISRLKEFKKTDFDVLPVNGLEESLA